MKAIKSLFSGLHLRAQFHQACGPGAPAAIERLEQRWLLSADVLTYHNDNARDGANLAETTLTPQNVNSNAFGKLFSYPVDGYVYAQPLVVSNLTMAGGSTHDVVFVATENDSVYAFDADSNAGANINPLWHDSFINPSAGITPVSSSATGTGDITPQVGITGTPVIDRSTNTLYVVTNTDNNGTFVQQLHALDITSGAEKFGGPTLINFTTPGVGYGSGNGLIGFNALVESQRPALAEGNGAIYIAWASHGDNGNYHGLLAAYSASNLQLESVLNVTPNNAQGGIWMGGSGPAIDSNGNIFLSVGNGTFDNNADWGDSMLRIVDSGTALTVADSFTPFNQQALTSADLDFGSGGVMLLPPQDGATPDEAISGGKDGNAYLVNRDNMGGFSGSGNTNLQTISVATGGSGIYDTPAYFNGDVYINAQNEGLQQYPMVNGALTGPSHSASESFAFPGATPSISANGSADGIAWEIEYGSNATLHAYDASNVSDELYNSNQAGSRDQLGLGVKFAVPTVVNGHVYVATATSLEIFGLLSSQGGTIPATPTNLAATAESPTDVHLDWTANSTNAASFAIERSTDGTHFNPVGSTAGTATTYDDTTAVVGTTYYYQVVADDSAGSSGPSNVASATTATVPGLVGYWQFNEGSGTSTADASGNNDTGALNGEITWIAGKVGPAALNFHGAGVRANYVDIANESQLQFTASDSFTLGVWVQPNALDSKWSGIVTKSTADAPGYGLYLDPSNHWVFATSSGENAIEGPVADTNWHYLTLVQDGSAGTRSLYVDGTLAATGTAEDGSGAGDLWVGGSQSTDQEFFNGAVDDLRIYNTALTAAEIETLSKVPTTVPVGSGSISGTVFDDLNSNGVQDEGEAGVSGATVFIDVAGTGTLAENDPTDVTDGNGNFTLGGLGDGTYKVIVVPTSETHITSPAVGYQSVTLSGGNAVTGINFGEVDNDQPVLPSQFALELKSTLPASVIGGAKGTATLRVTNTSGVKFHDPVQLALYLSTSTTLDNTATSIATPIYHNVSLKVGGKATYKIRFQFPDTVAAGSYYLLGSVTTEKSVGEDQALVDSPGTVTISPPVLSLQPSLPAAIPVSPGKRATAKVVLSNDGNVNAVGPVTISLYSSNTQSLDGSESLLTQISKSVHIKPGRTAHIAVHFVPPADLAPGSYYLLANLNAQTTVPNTATVTLASSPAIPK